MRGRRRFGVTERVALFLSAKGKCSSCGCVLEPGWHADHVRPYSRGGETDVINGQALCPKCNLQKGNAFMDLRQWQTTALDRMLRTASDFLCVACPGAGKTAFALTAARNIIERREADRLIVVVPTSHLRQQWAEAAVREGIRLDHRFENGTGAIARDMGGAVVTYQAVAANPDLYRMLATQRETLVILDEVHHGGDSLSWGEALKRAFAPAARRLLLSGTPSRTDRKPVPFVSYDDGGSFVADGGQGYVYNYGAGIQDHAVRPLEFMALDGGVRWREAGKVLDVTLADADDETLANALRSALHPDGEWIRSVLLKANEELTRHRQAVPDAGGLVVAFSQKEATKYADILRGFAGEPPTLAISDEPDASDRIKDFAKGRSRWLVAVEMVSEGVDIPRLAVGVYATRKRTELFFRQVVGRFVRMRGRDDETTATLLIPSIEPLLRYAQAIEHVVNLALKQEEESVRREIEQREMDLLPKFDFDPLQSTEAAHYATILSGDSFTDDELRRAEVHARAAGLPPSVTVSQVARLIRLVSGGTAGSVATNTLQPPRGSVTTVIPADEKAQLRSLISKKVGRLHRLSGAPYAHIHQRMNEMFGDKMEVATTKSLEARLDWLEEQIRREG
jgi:superfamily II DNA or RNA helicase